jgi:photosystem II stability/assembly factor-like uncharacterized protein
MTRQAVFRGVWVATYVALLGACAHGSSPSGLRPTPGHQRPDAPGERAAFDLARRLPPGAAAIDPAWYMQAQSAALRMPDFATAAGRFVASSKSAPRWQALGPGNVAGRTRTLVFDPRDPDRLLAGGVSGGVWESTDAGASWRSLSDAAANVNIGALLIDPVEPDTIYAGTGELFRNSQRPYSAMWGQGILRSTDNGANFRQLLATANDDFRYVSDLVVSPHDHRRLYAATNTGVWRSDDGGNRFVQVLAPTTSGGGLLYEGCTDLAMLPAADGADTLLVSCASRSEDDRYWLPGTVVPPACGGPCPGTVFRSDDAAAASPAWQVVLSEPGMGRTSLAVAPSNPDIVYALSASIVPGPDRNGDGRGDYDNGLHALFRSTDAGRSWTARVRNTSPDVLSTYLLSYADGFEAPRCGFGSFDAYSAGWYNQAIAVNPLDPDIVWVGGMEVYRSDNGGSSFGKASYWWLDGSSPFGVHADVHLIAFHPDYAEGTRLLYLTNDGGVARTEQDGARTNSGPNAACGPTQAGVVPWITLESGMTSTQFYTGTVNANGSLLLGGAQDNGTLLQRASFGNAAFQEIFGGDGASVAIDPRNDNVLYVSYQNVNIHRSQDGGRGFTRATDGIVDTPIFIMPFIIDTQTPNRLYAAGTRLWRSNDQGRHWVAASAALGASFGHRVSALAVSPADNSHLLMGNQFGIHRSNAAASSNGSSVFASSSPRSGWVSSLAFDPVDPNVAYATYSTFGGSHVWRSVDGGASWSAIDGSGDARLPDLPVHHLVVDPNHRDRLYVGTDLGVFVTLDGGQHWAQENAGFANVIVERLAIAPNAAGGVPKLYAFTYGRGVWSAPLTDFDGEPAYRIGADSSGGFFDPAQDGHGWLIESTPIDGTAGVVATWYTYRDGEPVWLVGAAAVDGDRARIPMSISRGGDFPPDFDPSAVTLEPWGVVELQFSSRDSASVNWTTAYPGFADGSMSLTRLTRIATPRGAALDACHSGSWFEPSQSGHGLQVEVIGEAGSEQLVVAWFTYLDGAQRWLLGAGPINGGSATLPMTITRGGQFPPDFDPSTIERTAWGSLTFRASGPDRAHVQWQSAIEGFGSGSLDLVRLTALSGSPCP